MTSGYVEFEFDLPDALLRNLVSIFDRTPSAALTEANAENVPEEQGVYQLLLDNQIVYVGKTDAEAGLHKRLVRHSRKILSRKNLNPRQVTFKAVRIFVFTAINLESALIRHYGGVRGLAWNGSGFGSNDPGQRRDRTIVDPTNYDAIYPIDIDTPVTFSISAGETAASVAMRLKETLPYTFRYQGSEGGGRRAHDELINSTLGEAAGPMTARSAIKLLVESLPPGWQATALPGYIIMYRENQPYPASEIIARS